MRLRGYYLFAPTEPGCLGPDSGIERKIRAQCAALNQYLDCELIILPPVEFSGSPAERLRRRLPLTAGWRRWKYAGEFDGADFLYIRQVYHDASFVRYLKAVKRANPNMKIIYEVPTYPYGTDTRLTLSNYALIKKDRGCCKKAARYIDRIVTFYGQDEIWGVPCIRLMNGFDFSAIDLPMRTPSPEIHVLSVAKTAFWHGYDRLLSGLGKYYAEGGTEQLVYHMIGDVLPEHEKLVRELSLQQHVVFHGRMSAEEMRPIYVRCLLAVDVLGGHRIGYTVSSSLKSREYAAYGLPVLSSSPIDYLPADSPWQLLLPYDDSPVSIPDVLRYYHRLYDAQSCDAVAKAIRSYAEARCDMHVTISPVAEWLEDS